MPPRFAYWTIILDGAPTSFRTKDRDEILPLFNQLKAKNPGALLKWFSGGRLWDSPEQAKEVRNVEKVRRFRDERSKETKEQREAEDREMAAFREKHGRPADGSDQPRSPGSPTDAQVGPRRPGFRTDRPVGPRRPGTRPDAPVRPWRPGSSFDSPRDAALAQDKADPGSSDPLAEFRRQHGRPPDGSDQRVPAPSDRSRGASFGSPAGRLAQDRSAPREGRPPSERRNKDWRPGGEHKDPRDKYKLPPGEARKRWKERNLGPRPSTRGGDDRPLRAGKPGGGRPWDAPRAGGRGASQPRAGRTGEGHPSTGGNGPDRTRDRKPFGDRPWSGKARGPGGTRRKG